MREPSRQLVEAASWRLVAEMVRRHPYLRVIETHPCDGQYDCLNLLLSDDPAAFEPCIALNRPGSARFFLRSGQNHRWPEFWEDYLSAQDPSTVINQVCDKAGLPAVRRLPASTPPVLVYRFAAAFMAQTILGRETWQCRGGYCDSADMGGSRVRDEWFDPFPAARTRLGIPLSDDLLGEPAYRFWFVCQAGVPKLCLEIGGLAWDLEGTEFDLMKLYRVRHRIWPVVSFVARDLLP